MKKERKYFVAIGIIIALFLVSSYFWNLDIVAKIMTTCTTLIAAVSFWLQLKRNEDLNETKFILDLNNHFIGNKNMTRVEHALELYYNNHIIGIPKEQNKLQLNMSRESDDCQALIDYLVYLESISDCVKKGVLHLDVIDHLFAYRFFLAVNNPYVQEAELLPFKDFYLGCYWLCEEWAKQYKKKDQRIPMKENLLCNIDTEAWHIAHRELYITAEMAQPSDDENQIAACLYDTDELIYPTAFGSNRQLAIHAIKKIMNKDNSLFNKQNILISRYYGHVCGVILIRDEKETEWNTEEYYESISNLVPSKEQFAYASENYFKKMAQAAPIHTVEIVAVCVGPKYRQHKIATKMFEKLFEMYPGYTFILDVLKDNEAALGAYAKLGFVPNGEYKGFAFEESKRPDCIHMIKKAEK